MKMRPFTLSLIFLLFLASLTVNSCKKDGRGNCNENPWCKRARSGKPGSCNLIAHDVSISNGDLAAKLIPKAPQPEDEGQIKAFKLCLSVNQVGIMRLKIDPTPSPSFQVADVDVPAWVKRFEARKLWLQKAWTEKLVGGDGDGGSLSSVVSLSDSYEAVLRHDPFEVYVREKEGKGRLLSFNSHGLFDFDHYTISFDISFYGSDSAYGITDHLAMSLEPTRGPVEESESEPDSQSVPYTWFNLDAFRHLNYSPSGFYFYGWSPFMAAHDHKSRNTSGFLWLNVAEMQIDVFGNNGRRIDTLWMSKAAPGFSVDTFFLVGPKPKDVVGQYTSAIGLPAQTLLLRLALERYGLIFILLLSLLGFLFLVWVNKLVTDNNGKK